MSPTRLLIVVDDSIVRLDLHQLLQAMGYVVAGEAGDGVSALHVARELRPDLVLMDLGLAGDMDGIAAASALAREGIAPVLLLTAVNNIELAERAAKAGVAGDLVNPFHEEQLQAAIEIALRPDRAGQGLISERSYDAYTGNPN